MSGIYGILRIEGSSGKLWFLFILEPWGEAFLL